MTILQHAESPGYMGIVGLARSRLSRRAKQKRMFLLECPQV